MGAPAVIKEPEIHILVFGSGGFIGSCLCRAALDAGEQVTGVQHVSRPCSLPGLSTQVCDITNAEQISSLLDTLRPDAVFNLAGIANIDKAEIEREAAFIVNAAAAGSLARSCARRGIRLVHYSTDAVYSGTHSPIREEDPPSPLNYYGCTKAAGDQLVLSEHPGAVILRISLALGFPVSQPSNSFLSMLWNRFSSGVEVFAPENEVRTPVDIQTLCAASLELASVESSGILHIGSTESINRYSLTVQLADAMGFSPELVRRTGAPHPGRAVRHQLGVLDVSRIQTLVKTPMLNIMQTIRQALLDMPNISLK